MLGEIKVVEKLPTVGEYQELRRLVGWEKLDFEVSQKGLENALYTVCLVRDEEVIGCGRIIGDGAIYFYIQDIIVSPKFQGMGFGARIMEKIMNYISENAGNNSFIGLMSAKGFANFYKKYGFEVRPDGRPGMFKMWKKDES